MVTTPPLPIFVTGASSGIGNHLTRTLAAHGFPVFASARKDKDLEELAALPNVTPVRLDVRDPQQIQKAAGQVASDGRGLYGLVNNAGVGDLGMVSTWSDDELFDIFNVNVFGPFRITNTFIPLLVQSHGRVVLVGSQGGMLSKKYYGPYSMTKHALEAYSVALKDELSGYGVGVSIVQPGGVMTNMGANSFPGILARFRRAGPPFKSEADAVLASFDQPSEDNSNEAESDANRKPSPPQIVTEAVIDALFSETPKFRYLVGTRWEGNRVLNALIEKLLDENDNPVHHYTEEELVRLLRDKIAERKDSTAGRI